MNEKQEKILKEIANPFGQTWALEKWIGKEDAKMSDKLVDRYLESRTIELTSDEEALLERIESKNIPW